MALAEGEDDEPIRPRLEGMGVLEREVHGAVPRPDCVRRLVGPVGLNGNARPLEDEEDLLLRPL